MAEVLKSHHIKLFSTTTKVTKAAAVERSIRGLKRILYKIMEEEKTKNWARVLPRAVAFFNNIKSRITKFKPSEIDKSNEKLVWENRYGKDDLDPMLRHDLGIGTKVRKLIETDSKFRKGYLPRFSSELFGIARLAPTDPPTYILAPLKEDGSMGLPLNRSFYREELSRVKMFGKI